MCGRYSLLCIDDLGNRFRVNDPAIGFKSHFNIAPSTEQPVVVHGNGNALVPMRWGLVPSWAKDPAAGYRMINARAETLLEKPAFRPLLKKKRCLVPASGFFEWKKHGAEKIPFYFFLRETPLFAFAGLHDAWTSPDGRVIRSFTIITTAPNSLVAQVHDRMPAILLPENEERWVGEHPVAPADLPSLLAPYPKDAMAMHRVSGRVNTPVNDTPDIIEPVGGV